MIRRPTWVLLAIFIILIGVLFLWQRSQVVSSGNATPTPAIEFLFETQGETIVRFRFSNMDGHSIEVLKAEDGLWELVEPVEKQGDSARIESGLSTIAGLRLITKLDTDLDKRIIGLDPPVNELEIELENGENMVAFIGELTPTGGGYYAYVEGEPLIVVDSFGIESLIKFLTDPPIFETPTPSPPP